MPNTDRLTEYLTDIKTEYSLIETSTRDTSMTTALDENNTEYAHKTTLSIDDTHWEILQYTTNGEIVFAAEKTYEDGAGTTRFKCHLFSEMPSVEAITAISNIAELEMRVRFGRLTVEFSCRSCGEETHIADIPSNPKEGPVETVLRCAGCRYCNQC
jgi:hypothetical protein